MCEEALEELLEVDSIMLSDEAKAVLKKDIPLKELFFAATQLGKNKVPGMDGLPIEFYISLWDGIRPVLLENLRDNLSM